MTAVLTGRYSNGKVWAIGAKNSATGTEMFGGKVDEAAQTLQDPQWGTKYSLVNGDVVGKWCPSPPIIGSLIGALFPPQGVWVPEVRESGGYVEVKLDVDVSAIQIFGTHSSGTHSSCFRIHVSFPCSSAR